MELPSHGRLALAAAAACLLARCAASGPEVNAGPPDAGEASPDTSSSAPEDAGVSDAGLAAADASPNAADSGSVASADTGASVTCPEDMVRVPGLGACVESLGGVALRRDERFGGLRFDAALRG